MPSGGYLGINLAHNYPHTHPKLHQLVLQMLKGIDMVLYESVHAAGLTCILEPVEDDRLVAPDAINRLEHFHNLPRLANQKRAPPHNFEEVTIDASEIHEDDPYVDEEFAMETFANESPCDSDDPDMDRSPIEHEEGVDRMRDMLKVRKRIVWLNHPVNKELCRAYMIVSDIDAFLLRT